MNVCPRYTIPAYQFPTGLFLTVAKNVEKELALSASLEPVDCPVVQSPCGDTLSLETAQIIHKVVFGKAEELKLVEEHPTWCPYCFRRVTFLRKDTLVVPNAVPLLLDLQTIRKSLFGNDICIEVTSILKFAASQIGAVSSSKALNSVVAEVDKLAQSNEFLPLLMSAITESKEGEIESKQYLEFWLKQLDCNRFYLVSDPRVVLNRIIDEIDRLGEPDYHFKFLKYAGSLLTCLFKNADGSSEVLTRWLQNIYGAALNSKNLALRTKETEDFESGLSTNSVGIAVVQQFMASRAVLFAASWLNLHQEQSKTIIRSNCTSRNTEGITKFVLAVLQIAEEFEVKLPLESFELMITHLSQTRNQTHFIFRYLAHFENRVSVKASRIEENAAHFRNLVAIVIVRRTEHFKHFDGDYAELCKGILDTLGWSLLKVLRLEDYIQVFYMVLFPYVNCHPSAPKARVELLNYCITTLHDANMHSAARIAFNQGCQNRAYDSFTDEYKFARSLLQL